MSTFLQPSPRQAGFSMIEVLVTLVILLVGLLGLAGMMIQSQRSEVESYQRVQATILLQDMAARINANRNVAQCYAFTPLNSSGPYLGTSDGGTLTLPGPTCSVGTAPGAVTPTTNQIAQYKNDLAAWNQLLQGAAETSGGSQTGAMVGARGCVTYDNTNLLTANDGTQIQGSGPYTVSIAWQGMGETFQNNTLLCGQNKYGLETTRRVASLTFRIGTVNNTN